jgi:hypothetical protein
MQSKMVSRAVAFGAQGVTLKYPAASWSGVRGNDGMVVFAILAEDVIVDGQGSRSLLWGPDLARQRSLVKEERLRHCVLALRHGQAEGVLAFEGGLEVDATLVLSLRVARHQEEYWAQWPARSLQ